jgi:hypothetical protein
MTTATPWPMPGLFCNLREEMRRKFMAKEQVTRRQKDVSRLLREKKQIRKDQIKSVKKK